MENVKKILVAVKNPDERRQPGALKAVKLAKALGASVEFFNALSSPVLLEVAPLTGTSLAELKREAQALRERRLDRLVAQAAKLGVKATRSVAWDYPPHEAVVRRARAMHADLIVAECHAHHRLAPWMVRLTDFELLRASPVPVLLLKNHRAWTRPTVLAALDPTHARAKPAGLDEAIIESADYLARKLRGTVHAAHAINPPLEAFSLGDPSIGAVTLAAAYEAQKDESRRKFADFADRHRIPAVRRRVVEAGPVFGIPKAARAVRASVVVMGAISRSGIKRLFIGNTAEQILEALPCDVLVLKPAHFVSRVQRKIRGPRYVAPTPIVPMPA